MRCGGHVRGGGWRGLASVAGILLVVAGCGDLIPSGPKAPPPLTGEPNDPSFPDDPGGPDDPSGPGHVPLEIREVEPAEGPVDGGVDIMVTGRGFADGLLVFFDQTPAPEITVIGPTVAIVRLPPHPAGRVDVTVAHPEHEGGAPETLPGAFRYVGLLRIDGVEPDAGLVDGGELVTVTGIGFTPDARAFIGGRPLIAPAVADAGTITGIAPPGAWGAVDVHVVGTNGTAWAKDRYTYGAPPRLASLSPVVGPAGTVVAIEGAGLGDDAVVTFGGIGAEVRGAARDGGRLEVVAPALPDAAPVDVAVQTRWGLAVWPEAFAAPDAAADPLVLACTHLAPARGPAAGGTRVELACRGLAYPGVTVSFGGAPAAIVTIDAAAGRLVATTPAGTGAAVVRVASAVAATELPGPFTYEPAPAVTVASVSPVEGPPRGGTPIVIRGAGFAPGAQVHVGALTAGSVRVVDATTIEATTPPGAPGHADVIVRQSGVEARLAGGFDFRDADLALALVTPPTAAQAGGTYLRVVGDGFGPDARVTIGGVDCPIVTRVSSAELHVRSPHIAVGAYDAVVSDGGRTATLERALTVYDPRSGFGGTWGDPIDEVLNVTVWGSNGYGAVAGAFVIVGDDPTTPWQGVTDENGQVTISGPGLVGPVEVTASREAFTSYSVLAFDATNLTIILQQNPVPPPPNQGNGNGEPDIPPPTARINGHVTGLGKYVIAPPGSCASVAVAETDHCRACGAEAPVPQCGEGFACVDTGPGGEHCVASCAVDAECPVGYRCGATTDGARCLPSVGVPAAYCNVSSTSLFGYEYPIQATGWVDEAGHFSLDAMRIGEVAIYCIGGYRDDLGAFTPTIMGVERHLFAGSGQTFDGLEIALEHPLERSFRLRLMDPPTWSTGLADPQIVVSLDLGADGVIPMSRSLVPAGDLTWIAPRQLSALGGDLYDAQYFFYTTLAPNVPGTYQPRAYNLVQNVTHIVEDRFPVRDADGRWRLEGTQLDRDLLAVWVAPDGGRAFAVGEGGTILGWTSGGFGGDEARWTQQTSFTEQTLRAIAGGDGDLWAVGDGATVRRWDGLAWRAVDGPGPDDTLQAVAVDADAVLVAGRIRLRRYDRASGVWSVVGGPALQEVRGLATLPDGRVLALGTGGRAWVSDDGLAFTALGVPADVTATLRAATVVDDTLVIVGDAGVLLVAPFVPGAALGPLARVASPTELDLNALAVDPAGDLVIVGDHGTVLAWPDIAGGGAPWLQVVDDYRSEAHGVFVGADGRARIVGSAAFILGPFLHFPIVTSPVHDATIDTLQFAWTWASGPDNQYTQLRLVPEASIAVWTLIVDGGQTTATLPDLEAAAGISALPNGRIRFEVLRVLNRNFSIDDYTTREFSIYARDSWSTNEAWFFLP